MPQQIAPANTAVTLGSPNVCISDEALAALKASPGISKLSWDDSRGDNNIGFKAMTLTSLSHGNCLPFSAVTSLTQDMIYHAETTGCDITNTDYCLLGDPGDPIYFSDRCNSGPLPGTVGGTWVRVAAVWIWFQ